MTKRTLCGPSPLIKTCALVVIGLAYGHGLVAQNLVQNPSFEEFTGSCSGSVNIWELVAWQPPDCGTFSGYFNACNNASFSLGGVPANGSGYEPAHSGQSYAGINTFGYNTEGGNPRMYLSVPLTEELVAGEQYCIGLWMSLADTSSFRTTTLHAFLWYGQPSICAGNDSLWESYAAVTFDISAVDTSGWTLLEGSFTASGGEVNLTIGQFLFGDQIDTTSIAWHLSPYAASYYIDDVYLGACDGIGLPELSDRPLEFNLSPCPAMQGEQVRYTMSGTKGERCTLALFDMAGQCVMTRVATNGTGALHTDGLAPGSYIVIASTPHQCSRKLLIIR